MAAVDNGDDSKCAAAAVAVNKRKAGSTVDVEVL
jgi:hypothetical protein